MNKTYQVAGHCFRMCGEQLCKAVERIVGFRPFECEGGKPLFEFVEGTEAPVMEKVQYTFAYEDVTGTFGRWDNGFLLTLKPEQEEAFHLWTEEGGKTVWLCGNWSVRLYRFALWVGYGLMTLPFDTVAIHSSCIVYKDKAILFLGESGTGKSTHSRMWRTALEGVVLMNDDHPVLRAEDGTVTAYGSPWSGKTPCYKNISAPLGGIIRIVRAPHNRAVRLSPIQAYASLMTSCSGMTWDRTLADGKNATMQGIISSVPCWVMECLPDEDAAKVCMSAVTSVHKEG